MNYKNEKINKITAVLLATISIIFLFSACSAGNNANVELTTFANATTTSDKSGTIVAESIPADKASTTAKGSTSTTAQSTSQNGSTATNNTTKNKTNRQAPPQRLQKSSASNQQLPQKPQRKQTQQKSKRSAEKQEGLLYHDRVQKHIKASW